MSTVLGMELLKGWNSSKLKHATTLLSRGSAPNYVDDGPVRVVSQAANQANGIDWARTRFHDFAGSTGNLRGYLLPRDLLINSTGTGTLGRVGYFYGTPDSIPCMADSHVTVARAAASLLDPRFAYYWLASQPFQEYIYAALIVGATNQIELNRDQLGNAPLPLPPLEEQRRIADFLDAELARQDALTAATMRQISLLEEHLESVRDTVITDRPDIKMTPLMHLTDPARPIVYGIVQAGPEVPGGVPYIKTGDLPGLDSASLSRTSAEIHHQYRRAGVRPGDIVIAMRASIGAAAIVPPELPMANLTQGTARIAPGRGVSGKWLYQAIQTRAAREQFNVRAVGSTFRTLNIWDLRRVAVPFIPHEEQMKTTSEFMTRLAGHESLISSAKRRISLLSERRQALITAAVTGQIDVTTARGVDVS